MGAACRAESIESDVSASVANNQSVSQPLGAISFRGSARAQGGLYIRIRVSFRIHAGYIRIRILITNP